MAKTFDKGIGRLATDRYDFQSHIDGDGFRHKADQVDIVPPVSITGYGPAGNVKVALDNISNWISSQATSTDGFITVGDGFNVWKDPGSSGEYLNAPVSGNPPYLDEFLNPIFQAIISGSPLSANYARIKNGGIVVIKSGTYLVRRPIIVPPGITIFGEGYGTKIINATNLKIAKSLPNLADVKPNITVERIDLVSGSPVKVTLSNPLTDFDLKSKDYITIALVGGTVIPEINVNEIQQIDTIPGSGNEKSFVLLGTTSSRNHTQLGNPGSISTRAPVFIFESDTSRLINDASVDTDMFMFSRDSVICNLVVSDNFVEPTKTGNSFYKSPQNIHIDTPLIMQRNGSNLTIQNIKLVGKGNSTSRTSKAVSVKNDATSAVTATMLKISDSFIDGFAVAVDFRTKNGSSDRLSITKNDIRCYGFSGYPDSFNSAIVTNDCNSVISENNFYTTASNLKSFLYLDNKISIAPKMDGRSKLNIQNNVLKIKLDSDTLNTNFKVFSYNTTNYPLNISSFVSALITNNNLQDTFESFDSGTSDSFISYTSFGPSSTNVFEIAPKSSIISNFININGQAFVKGGLSVDGFSIFNNNGTFNDTLNVIKKATLWDQLEVAGKTTLKDQLEVQKKATLQDELEVVKKATMDDQLEVVGKTTLKDQLEVVKKATMDDELFVNGETKLNSHASLYGATLKIDSTTSFKDPGAKTIVDKYLKTDTTNTFIRWTFDSPITTSPLTFSQEGSSVSSGLPQLTIAGVPTSSPNITSEYTGISGKKVLFFNGSGTYLSTGNTTINPNKQNITISVWVNLKSYNGNKFQIFMQKAYNPTYSSPYHSLQIAKLNQENGSWRAYIHTSSGGNWFIVDNPRFFIPLNKWTLLTVTYDGFFMRAYFNDQLAKYKAVSGDIDYGTNGSYDIGGRSSGDCTMGYIDDVRIENIARDSSYISDMYKSLSSSIYVNGKSRFVDSIYANNGMIHEFDFATYTKPDEHTVLHFKFDDNQRNTSSMEFKNTGSYSGISKMTAYPLNAPGQSVKSKFVNKNSGNFFGGSLYQNPAHYANYDYSSFSLPNGYEVKTADTIYNPGSRMTVSAWVYLNDYRFWGTLSSPRAYSTIVHKKRVNTVYWNPSDQSPVSFELSTDVWKDPSVTFPNGSWFVRIADTTSGWKSHSITDPNYLIKLNEWCLLSFTYDKDTGDLKLYFNGNLAGQINIPSKPDIQYGNGAYFVGYSGTYSDSSGTKNYPFQPFPGEITDVRIENTVRSADYIKSMYDRVRTKIFGKEFSKSLLTEVKNNDNYTNNMRMYHESHGNALFTSNAYWDESSKLWEQENKNKSSLAIYSGNDFAVNDDDNNYDYSFTGVLFKKSGSNNWDNVDWSTRTIDLHTGIATNNSDGSERDYATLWLGPDNDRSGYGSLVLRTKDPVTNKMRESAGMGTWQGYGELNLYGNHTVTKPGPHITIDKSYPTANTVAPNTLYSANIPKAFAKFYAWSRPPDRPIVVFGGGSFNIQSINLINKNIKDLYDYSCGYVRNRDWSKITAMPTTDEYLPIGGATGIPSLSISSGSVLCFEITFKNQISNMTFHVNQNILKHKSTCIADDKLIIVPDPTNGNIVYMYSLSGNFTQNIPTILYEETFNLGGTSFTDFYYETAEYNLIVFGEQ